MTGFVMNSTCVWGTVVSGEAFVSTRGQTKYSATGLCHELLHLRIEDHKHRDERWATVEDCKAFLARNPDRDVMQ
jgi:hypothetical protein